MGYIFVSLTRPVHSLVKSRIDRCCKILLMQQVQGVLFAALCIVSFVVFILVLLAVLTADQMADLFASSQQIFRQWFVLTNHIRSLLRSGCCRSRPAAMMMQLTAVHNQHGTASIPVAKFNNMLFSKGRIIGLICTVATLIGAMVILRNINADNELSKLESVLNAPVLLGLFGLYGAHFLAEPARWLAYTRHPAFTPSVDPGVTLTEPCGQAPVQAGFVRIFACFNITALLSYSLPFKLGLPIW